MPSHVNLSNKDLSKFSKRAVRCLRWWLDRGFRRQECPFNLGVNSYCDYSSVDNYKCRNFCFKVFSFKLVNGDYRKCPCERLSEKYVISTVREIIKLKEAEHAPSNMR